MSLVLIVLAHIGESLIRSLGLHKENHIEVGYRYLEGGRRHITLWAWGSGNQDVLEKLGRRLLKSRSSNTKSSARLI